MLESSGVIVGKKHENTKGLEFLIEERRGENKGIRWHALCTTGNRVRAHSIFAKWVRMHKSPSIVAVNIEANCVQLFCVYVKPLDDFEMDTKKLRILPKPQIWTPGLAAPCQVSHCSVPHCFLFIGRTFVYHIGGEWLHRSSGIPCKSAATQVTQRKETVRACEWLLWTAIFFIKFTIYLGLAGISVILPKTACK